MRSDDLQAVNADPPIDETPPTLDEVREAVSRPRFGKVSDVCNFSAELVKAGDEAMNCGVACHLDCYL